MLIGAHLSFGHSALSAAEVAGFQQAARMPGQALPQVIKWAMALGVGYEIAQPTAGELLLFSGHLQNRAHLRLELGISEGNDAELYAAGYAAWGDAVDLRVIGSYATILLNCATPTIRLASSPISCPPLHYRHDGSQFLVASRVQALFDTGRVNRVVSEHKIADSLFLNYRDPQQGWFEGVTRLAAGTRAYVTPDGVSVMSYYDLAAVPDVRLARDHDYVEAAESLFCEGAQGMLDGFHRPAVSLSGGYDSQAVAAYVLRMRPEDPLNSYTSVPEEGWDGIIQDTRFGDERHHVEALAALYPRLQTHWVAADGLSFDHFQRDMFAFSLQAQRNAMNLHWIHESRRQAKADGCDVMLTGDIGNATFSYTGEQALSGWLAKGQIWPVVKELLGSGSATTLPRRFVGRALLPLLPRKIWQQIMKFRHGAEEDPFDSWCPMNRDYAAQMDVAGRAEAVGFDPLFRPPADSRTLRSRMLIMAGGEGADTNLALQMIHGLPSRDPTSYRPLVEFCLGIPDDQYLRKGVRRWLAKRMLKGKVPEMVLNETRRGRQAADWHLRLSRQRETLIEEIDWLMEDQGISARLDLGSLRQALIDFPKETPLDKATSARLQLAVTRGLTTARFIRYLEGRNF